MNYFVPFESVGNSSHESEIGVWWIEDLEQGEFITSWPWNAVVLQILENNILPL
jgi:hypothetical protein